MSSYRFELAGEQDDADLRHVLAHTPMPGDIEVTFRREPSYFAAAVVDGNFRQVVAAREQHSQRIVGFGSRSIGRKYVNGTSQPIGYLSSLRLLAGHRNRGLVARGYAYFRRLHQDGRTRLYLTTIAEGNQTAIAQLTSRRAGLPAYQAAGRYHTLAIPMTLAAPRPGGSSVEIRRASVTDLTRILSFLKKHGPRRQFFPEYQESDFFTQGGALCGLAASDLLLVVREGELAGLLGRWNQQRFRQAVVERYRNGIRWVRPLYNGWAALSGRPRLPTPGQTLNYLTAAIPTVAGDDPVLFRALLEAACIRWPGESATHLLVGLHERDPLLPATRPLAAACYSTMLYLVCFDDGEALRASLDDRPPYLELGSL